MSTSIDPRNVTVSAPAASPRDPDPRTEAQVAADLERRRAELAATIDQLYTRVQPAALAQDAKENVTARLASFKETASLTLQNAAEGDTEALRRVGIVALSAVGALGVIAWLVTRPARRSRRQARRTGREAAALVLSALASNESGTR